MGFETNMLSKNIISQNNEHKIILFAQKKKEIKPDSSQQSKKLPDYFLTNRWRCSHISDFIINPSTETLVIETVSVIVKCHAAFERHLSSYDIN